MGQPAAQGESGRLLQEPKSSCEPKLYMHRIKSLMLPSKTKRKTTILFDDHSAFQKQTVYAASYAASHAERHGRSIDSSNASFATLQILTRESDRSFMTSSLDHPDDQYSTPAIWHPNALWSRHPSEFVLSLHCANNSTPRGPASGVLGNSESDQSSANFNGPRRDFMLGTTDMKDNKTSMIVY